MIIRNNKYYRMNRLFQRDKGRTFMVAIDHGQGGVLPGLENPEKLIRTIIEANPDAVIMGPGLMRRFRDYFAFREAPALILSVDTFLEGTLPKENFRGMEAHRVTTSLREAVRMGADAVKILMIWGRESVQVQADNFEFITRISEESQSLDLPVIIEPTLWGERASGIDKQDKDLVVDLARIAFEAGADMLKLEAQPEFVPDIIKAAPIPLTLLGGSIKDDFSGFLERIKLSIQNGAAGMVVGRNVWQADNIIETVKSFKDTIYNA